MGPRYGVRCRTGPNAWAALRPDPGQPVSESEWMHVERSGMWVVVKTLIREELSRLWRRLLRKPEPPGPFAEYRNRKTPPPPSTGTD